MAKQVINIDPKSPLPKYRQIINSVLMAIEKKILRKGDRIPSINKVCAEFNLSRDTVMLAFNELKAKKILFSQAGKGYYIHSTEIPSDENIFVLFDELNAFKEDLYYSLLENTKGKAVIDIYFHHFNFKQFKNLVSESAGHFTSYIIMPATFDNSGILVSKLPHDRVYILDRLKPDLKSYSAVYQDFENDLYSALRQEPDLLKKYRKLIFVNPGGKEPIEREKGFTRYCLENGFNYQILKTVDGVKPELYEAYFLVSDRDLVEMLKLARYYNLKLGRKFGIVSFNDSMLKEVVAGGITTISTDFREMGKTLAEMVLTRKNVQIKNPSGMIVRSSL